MPEDKVTAIRELASGQTVANGGRRRQRCLCAGKPLGSAALPSGSFNKTLSSQREASLSGSRSRWLGDALDGHRNRHGSLTLGHFNGLCLLKRA